MAKSSSIVDLSQAYAKDILSTKLPEEILYHSLEHTIGVVEAVELIGKESGLTDEQLEIATVAGWFHDLGYSETMEAHEERSAEMALAFLDKHHYASEKADQVKACILATTMPQNPQNLMEQVICDADLMHLGTEDYFEKSNLLHKEMSHTQGEKISKKQWMKMNQTFIGEHQFFTEYAQKTFGEKEQENLKEVEKKLKEMKGGKESEKLQRKIEELQLKLQKTKELTPTRGIETMFRLTSKNHLDLSGMADNKANIMISINSIILSVLVSVILRKLEEYPHLMIPSLIMTIVCLITIVFAILATRPNVSRGKFTRDDIHQKKTNLLFFGNFHSMDLPDYEWGMKEMLKDANYLYSSLIRDIYFLGVVLGKKYKLLRISYTVFMFGFVISILSFVIAEVFFKAPYPY
ncbi:MAG: HD domain-containing protein [Cyclobacteriaceae bacterium]|nr:HD domain-containing protein [Cyclobacteriaceae bacterium HetDA_MAG_MS6]